MTERPSWQVEDCPAWCTREHREDDQGSDRDHVSEAEYVPVVRLERHPGSDSSAARREAVADELLVVRFQGQDDPHAWAAIAFPEFAHGSIEVSEESALRFIRGLREIL